MKVSLSVLNTKGVHLQEENPLPMFRSRQHDSKSGYDETLTEKDKHLLGYETGFRVLPYCMQDRYTRDKKPIQLKTVVLENDKMKATFLCDYGAKLHSLIKKSTGKELLFSNSVIQPGNLAIRNAWTSGGIEWNIGQLGHTFTTCEPMFMAKLVDKKGQEFVRAYEYERCKGLFWYIDFYLPKGEELLYAYVRIANPSSESTPMYWWTNIAVPESYKTRVFSNTSRVLCIKHGVGWNISNLPNHPSLEGVDVSYSKAFPFANEFFFQNEEDEPMPWEAVVNEDGTLFIEASTSKLPYRKMFCWGNKQGGQHWQDYLSEPNKGNYVEVQGGMAPTQLHGIDMPAKTVWDFVQVFGETTAPKESHDKDWNKAQKKVSQALKKNISKSKLYKMLNTARKNAEMIPEEFLNTASGWGALEQARLESKGKEIPQGFAFPEFTMGKKELVWLNLLNNNQLYEIDENDIPPSWMVQEDWLKLLSESLKHDKNKNWFAYMHLGNMLYEKGEEEKAFDAWEKSIELKPSEWVYRNFSYAKKQKGDNDAALNYMEKAYDLNKSFCDAGFYEEYFTMLEAKNEYEKIWNAFEKMPDKFKQLHRLQIIFGKTALKLDKLEAAEFLFEKEFAVIREGELTVVDMWYLYSAKKIARERGIEYNAELLEEAKKNCPPPKIIDHRMN